jgi:hypothetical protein
MPIDYQIDHTRRLVTAQGRGVLSDQDVFEYQRNVWSRTEVAGYDELVDMCAVERIAVPSAERVAQLAVLSASMDVHRPSKFAIVAPQHVAFGLGRMYQINRGLEESSTKEVGVFRTRTEALEFLGLDGDVVP